MTETTTPRYDILRAHRIACDLGITAAERCLNDELLKDYHAAYARRAADYRAARDRIDAALAAWPIAPVYAGGRRAELAALRRAYAAGQVTPHEFASRMKHLMGAHR